MLQLPLDPELVSAAFENSFEFFTLINSDGTILHDSSVISSVLGFTSECRVGKNFFNFVHPDDTADAETSWRRLNFCEPGKSKILRIRNALGAWRHIECRATHFIEGDRAGQILLNCRDAADPDAPSSPESVSRQNFRNLLDAIPDGVIIHDKGKCLVINRALLEMTRCLEAEVMGGSLFRYISPEFVPLVMQKMQLERESRYEAVFLRTDGTTFPAEVFAKPYVHEGRMLRLAVIRDLSQHAAAKEILTRAGVEIRSIWESMTDSFFALDFNWRFTYINPPAEHVLRCKREDLIGKEIWTEYPSARESVVFEKYHQALETQKPVHFDYYFNESQLWLEIHVYPSQVGLGIYIRDVTERKIAEFKLSENEVKFRAVFESVQDGILLADGSGNYVEANQAAGDLFQTTRENLIGRNLLDFIPPEGHVSALQSWNEFLTLGWQNGEIDLMRPDGTRLTVEYRAVANVLPSTHLSLLRDITERKKGETIRQRLASIVEFSNDAIVSFDRHSVLLSWNRAAELLFGYTAAEAIGQPLSILLPPDVHQETVRLLEKVWNGERVSRQESQRLSKSGERIPVSISVSPLAGANGEVTGASAIVRDIRQEKAAAETLTRLASIVEGSAEAIIGLNTSGQITSWNRGAALLYGYQETEAIGRRVTLIVPPEKQPEIWSLLARVKKGEVIREHETKRLRNNGTYLDVSLTISPLMDAAGNVTGCSAITRDITDTKKLREHLKNSKVQLEQRVEERTLELAQSNRELSAQIAERQQAVATLREVVQKLEIARQEAEEAQGEADKANNAKSEFLSRMSHELRTPLNAILGFGQILEMRELGSREKRGVGEILKAGRHLLQLINEILEISRIEAGSMSISIEPIKISWLIQEVFSMVQPLAAMRNIQLIHEVAQSSESVPEIYVMADARRLQQVMLNLLSNAIKYNRNGGTVTVRIHEINVKAASGLPSYRIDVADNGPGIAAADQRKIFTPFERLRAAETNIEGTGIGLSLCQRLMEIMDGRIGLESEIDCGSTFWIELPGAGNPVDEASRLLTLEANQGVAASLRNLRGTVLYIEDNLSNLTLMKSVFEEFPGLILLTEDSGRSGLETAFSHTPDIILLDLNLPDLQGDDVIKHLRSNPGTSDIPVVMVSAAATKIPVERLISLGAANYLTKPIELTELAKVLSEFLPASDRSPASAEPGMPQEASPKTPFL